MSNQDYILYEPTVSGDSSGYLDSKLEAGVGIQKSIEGTTNKKIRLSIDIGSGNQSKYLRVNSSGNGVEWVNPIPWSDISKTGAKISDLDVPSYLASKYLRVNSNGTGLEWADIGSTLPPTSGLFNKYLRLDSTGQILWGTSDNTALYFYDSGIRVSYKDFVHTPFGRSGQYLEVVCRTDGRFIIASTSTSLIQYFDNVITTYNVKAIRINVACQAPAVIFVSNETGQSYNVIYNKDVFSSVWTTFDTRTVVADSAEALWPAISDDVRTIVIPVRTYSGQVKMIISKDGGYTWSVRDAGNNYNTIRNTHISRDGKYMISGQWYSVDYGETWKQVSGLTSSSKGCFMSRSGQIMASYDASRIVYSLDYGLTWNAIYMSLLYEELRKVFFGEDGKDVFIITKASSSDYFYFYYANSIDTCRQYKYYMTYINTIIDVCFAREAKYFVYCKVNTNGYLTRLIPYRTLPAIRSFDLPASENVITDPLFESGSGWTFGSGWYYDSNNKRAVCQAPNGYLSQTLILNKPATYLLVIGGAVSNSDTRIEVTFTPHLTRVLSKNMSSSGSFTTRFYVSLLAVTYTLNIFLSGPGHINSVSLVPLVDSLDIRGGIGAAGNITIDHYCHLSTRETYSSRYIPYLYDYMANERIGAANCYILDRKHLRIDSSQSSLNIACSCISTDIGNVTNSTWGQIINIRRIESVPPQSSGWIVGSSIELHQSPGTQGSACSALAVRTYGHYSSNVFGIFSEMLSSSDANVFNMYIKGGKVRFLGCDIFEVLSTPTFFVNVTSQITLKSSDIISLECSYLHALSDYVYFDVGIMFVIGTLAMSDPVIGGEGNITGSLGQLKFESGRLWLYTNYYGNNEWKPLPFLSETCSGQCGVQCSSYTPPCPTQCSVYNSCPTQCSSQCTYPSYCPNYCGSDCPTYCSSYNPCTTYCSQDWGGPIATK